jgi:hypothetical protein
MYHLSSSGTMNAAAPEGTPPRRISHKKNTMRLPVPPCIGEALRRVSIAEKIDFQNLGANTQLMPVSPEQEMPFLKKIPRMTDIF